jgi:hypothetical protein
LLAQKVLSGGTRGYRSHPQLLRFREQMDPLAVISTFLCCLEVEARSRGYRFDATKISERRFAGRIKETEGQLQYEWSHLKAKLRRRAPQLARQFRSVASPEAHPLFRIVPGDVREWEKI